MNENVSISLRTAFIAGRNFAITNRDGALKFGHVIYGILITDNEISKVLRESVPNYDQLIDEVRKYNCSKTDNKTNITSESKLNFEKLLSYVIQLCTTTPTDLITIELFFFTAMDSDVEVIRILKKYGIEKENINFKPKPKEPIVKKSPSMAYAEDENFIKPDYSSAPIKTKSKTPILDSYSRDLTLLATEGKLDPVIGREVEVDRVAQILSRKKKNNPVLIGEPGVGKTAIAEGLAIKIAKNECPRPLIGKKLVALDLTSLVAGTKYRGQFEERIKLLLEELRGNRDIILFIDELHTLVGAGNSSGSLDAANVFKPALARGEVQCIGATTLDEYREHIEKDGALERRFQKVIVLPTTIEETRNILMNIRGSYEEFHKVSYTDEAIDEIVRLSERYITNREFPDKAIDVLDEAGSRTQVNLKTPTKIKELEDQLAELQKTKEEVVQTQNYERAIDLRDLEAKLTASLKKENKVWKGKLNNKKVVIDADMICEVVSMMTNIPISKLSQNEVKQLLLIDKELANTIIGQDDAIEKVSAAIKRSRTGIRRQNRPIGSFLFIGPTGVGKTELAKVLAEKVFGSEEAMIRIDMSEYTEKFNVSKLIGSPPGYVGYDEGGQLTEKVKNKPYSLVLFDEIEKAHTDVFGVLLQLLDEGHLTDGFGRKINFKNTIVIMTSNIGLSEIQDFGVKIGFSTEKDGDNNSQSIIEKNLKKVFKPEFLNRLDEIVYFNYLGEEEIQKIVKLQMNLLGRRLKESNYTFKIDDESIKKLADMGYNKTYGAREIQRIIQKHIEDPMSQELLSKGMPKEAKFDIAYNSDEDKISVKII